MEIIWHACEASGQLIFFGTDIFDKNAKTVNIIPLQRKIARVIEHPTIVIDVIDSNRTRYYFRAIHWEKTLLVAVKSEGGMQVVKQYIENPTGAFMAKLFRNADYCSL